MKKFMECVLVLVVVVILTGIGTLAQIGGSVVIDSLGKPRASYKWTTDLAGKGQENSFTVEILETEVGARSSVRLHSDSYSTPEQCIEDMDHLKRFWAIK